MTIRSRIAIAAGAAVLLVAGAAAARTAADCCCKDDCRKELSAPQAPAAPAPDAR